jgi:hypothetical protein
MRGASCSDAQRLPSTSSWPSTRKVGPASGGAKIGPSRIPNRTVRFPRVRLAPLQPGAHLISDPRLHRGEIQKVGIIVNRIIIRCLTSRSAHQCLAVGASADDVSTLSFLRGVVQTVGSTTNSLPLGIVKTYRGFWPRRILPRRQPLRERRPPVGQEIP